MSVPRTASPRPAPPHPAARQPAAYRRTGYGAALVVDALLLVLVNGWPGWEVVPFLTEDFTRVLPIVNASLLAGVVANAMYLVADPPAVRALGDVVVTTVGLVALVAFWRVFPLAFPGQTFDWAMLARVLLVVAMVGSVIAVVVDVVALARQRTPRVRGRESGRPGRVEARGRTELD